MVQWANERERLTAGLKRNGRRLMNRKIAVVDTGCVRLWPADLLFQKNRRTDADIIPEKACKTQQSFFLTEDEYIEKILPRPKLLNMRALTAAFRVFRRNTGKL